MAETFAAIEADFVQFTSEIVWCTVTTVDGKGRPRSRILHPIWEVKDGRPIGWVVTDRSPVKARHLAANPYLACFYWSPDQNTVAIDCTGSWVEDAETRQHVWDLFTTAPPPRGYDQGAFGYGGPQNSRFTPLRLDPWRIQVMRFQGWEGPLPYRTWRRSP